jgi:hypothetical protein
MYRLASGLLILLMLFGCGGSDDIRYVEIEVEVPAANTAPVADAEALADGLVGQTFQLTSSASHDSDGDLLAYQWSVDQRPVGSYASILDTHAPTASFQPDVPGEYIITLIVHDGRIYSDPATTTITVITAPDAPVLFAEDLSGAIQLFDLSVVENFRNATNVNFSLRYTLASNDSTRVNVGVAVYAVDVDGAEVFSRELNSAIEPGETKTTSVSFGEPLTIDEYDSIHTWGVDPLTIYQ